MTNTHSNHIISLWVSQKGVFYEQQEKGITRKFWRDFQGFAACEVDKSFVHREKTFEGAEGEEGVV